MTRAESKRIALKLCVKLDVAGGRPLLAASYAEIEIRACAYIFTVRDLTLLAEGETAVGISGQSTPVLAQLPVEIT